MRKKLVGILLAFCLAGALTACDKKDSQEGAQADAAETPGASAEGQSLEDLELEQYVKLGTYKGIHRCRRSWPSRRRPRWSRPGRRSAG